MSPAITAPTAVTERIINLALLLGTRVHAADGVSTQHIRDHIYTPLDPQQSATAFEKMFNRDKDTLRLAGLIIQTDTLGNNRLISESSFCEDLKLGPAERATLALTGYAQLEEPLFPLPLALRLALTKLSALFDAEAAPALRRMPATSNLGNRDTEAANSNDNAGLYLEILLHACQEHNTLNICYTNAAGQQSRRHISPYGLFLLSGRWYLVAHDLEVSDAIRTFKLGRIKSLELAGESFHMPPDFCLSDWMLMPFEIGASPETFTTVIIPADHHASLDGLTRGRGSLEPSDDGSVHWHISYRNYDSFISFVLESNLLFCDAQDRDYAIAQLRTLANTAATKQAPGQPGARPC